jgi:hypothetical protein
MSSTSTVRCCAPAFGGAPAVVIKRQLGAGGHAKVYEAIVDGESVALKVLKAEDPTAVHEARMVRTRFITPSL